MTAVRAAGAYVRGCVTDPSYWWYGLKWVTLAVVLGSFIIQTGWDTWPSPVPLAVIAATLFAALVTGILDAAAEAGYRWANVSGRRAATAGGLGGLATFLVAGFIQDDWSAWDILAGAVVIAVMALVGWGFWRAHGCVRARNNDTATMAAWAAPTTLAELGQVMARWVEGELPWSPPYGGGPDPETEPLVPILAALNRAGFVTSQSQAAFDGTAYDGTPVWQRAAVCGFADDVTLSWLQEAIDCLGPEIRYAVAGRRRARWNPPDAIDFGYVQSRSDLADDWIGYGICSAPVIAALQDAYQVVIYEPEWCSANALWPLLAAALENADADADV